MDPYNIDGGDATLSQASAELDRMIAADAGSNPTTTGSQQGATEPAAGSNANAGQPDAGAAVDDKNSKGSTPKTDKATTDTPAAEAAAGKTEAVTAAEKAASEAAAATEAGKTLTPYEKAKRRNDEAWKAVNAEKADVRKRAEEIQKRETEIAAREAKLKEGEVRASRPKFGVADYESAALRWMDEAERLEAAGKFEEADEKKVLAKQSRAQAAHLRANPPATPPSDAQREAKAEAERKQWWGKAAIDFPEVAKAGTPESLSMQALVQAEPAILEDPKGMYYAARLANAETSAASVPALTKELDGLRAKVKELEGKLTIPNSTATQQLTEQSFDQKSEEQQFAELTSMAKGM